MITCEDIFNCEDVKELKRLVFEYYMNNEQGKTALLRFIKDIGLSRKGINEVIHRGNEKTKLMVIPYLRELIETGKIGKWERPKHPRKDRIVGFISIFNTFIFPRHKIQRSLALVM
jgi:hypothetical protein